MLWGGYRFIASLIEIDSLVSYLNSSPLFPSYSFTTGLGAFQSILVIQFFTFFSGLLLLLSKRIGWLFSVASSSIHILLITSSFVSTDQTKSYSIISITTGSILLVAFTITLIILFQKPIKGLIMPKPKDGFIILAVVLILLLNYFLTLPQ
jgi:hypothetical protein